MVLLFATIALLSAIFTAISGQRASSCGANEGFRRCGSCEPSCRHVKGGVIAPILCTRECKPPGCYCDRGYVRHNGKCVEPSKCYIIVQTSQATYGTPYRIKATTTRCGPFEQFNECAGCEETCEQVRSGVPMLCTAQCNPPQCQCQEGYARDENGRCVSNSECSSSGPSCAPFEIFRECSGCEETCDQVRNGEPLTCTANCRPPSCQCQRGYVRDENNRCVSRSECTFSNPNCASFEEFRQCSSCEETCEQVRSGQQMFCTRECKPPNCQCKRGYVRDDNGRCVSRSECSKANCAPFEEFRQCSSCEETCEQVRSGNPLICTADCKPPSCQCLRGLVRDENRRCVSRSECGGDSVCKLRPAAGMCEAAKLRWYYDSNTKTCETFTYGGCKLGANGNRFRTKKECRKNCSVCNLKPETGFCRASMPKWYYNPQNRKCDKFIYGGCGGNGNRFDTKKQCNRKCR